MFVLCFCLYVTFHLHVSLILGAISLIFVYCLTQIKFMALTGLQCFHMLNQTYFTCGKGCSEILNLTEISDCSTTVHVYSQYANENKQEFLAKLDF